MSDNWDLATGRAGKAHVTSAMEGWKMTGLLGTGRRVLKTRNQLKATLANVNTVTLDTGDMMFDGRHVSCDLSVDVTITNGSQGQKRIDIIAAHYHRDPTTAIETVEPYVFRGEPSGGTPSTPTIPSTPVTANPTDAYYPLYRVELDGLTVATPVALFTKQNSLQDLEDLIDTAKNDYAAKVNAEATSRANADTNLQNQINQRATTSTLNSNVTNLQTQITSLKNSLSTVKWMDWQVPSSDNKISFCRVNNLVFVNGNVKFNTTYDCRYTTAKETLPSGWRPIKVNTPVQFEGGCIGFSLLFSNSEKVVMFGNPNSAYATAHGAWVTADAMPA